MKRALGALASLALGGSLIWPSSGKAEIEKRAAGEALSYEACIKIAAQKNSDLARAKAELQSAEANLSAGSSPFLPDLSAEIFSKRVFEANEATDSHDASLILTQNLFNGFADQSELKRLRSRRDAARASYEIVRARVSAELLTAFAELLYTSRSIRLAEEIVTRRQANLDLVDLRFRGGHENKGALLLASAYLDEAKFDALQARNRHETARTGLMRVLGLENTEGLEIQGEPPLTSPPVSIDSSRLVSETPELREAKADEAASRASLKAAEAAFFPTLDFKGTFGKVDDRLIPTADTWQDSWSAKLLLTIPLFSGGRDHYGVKAARETLSASLYSLESLRRERRLAIEQAYNAYVEAVAREKVDAKFLDAERIRSMIARSKYKNGLLDFEEWDNVESDLIYREKSALGSARDRISAEASWQQSIGKGTLP
jgi:outer membrane protein TolC